jgi:sugar lactone lactonase YvrE
MRQVRLRLSWHRAGPLAAITALVIAGGASQGCGGGGGSSSSGSVVSPPFGSSVAAAALGPIPLDATPDPTGTTIYFTGVDPVAGPGVFSVPADASNTTPVAVQVGPPFAAPFGIAISTDGKTLYVADSGATDTASNQDLGVIFSLPVGGGTPAILSGSALSEARSLEVQQVSDSDVVFYTGLDQTNGSPGVFKLPASGGAVTTVAEGSPFSDPCGIAIAADGTLYVTDTIASGSQTASVFKVDSTGAVTTFTTDLRVGYPAGIALSKDDKTLFVSSLDPLALTDQVLQLDVATMAPGTPFTMGINTFTEAAGLHRAKNADVFSWADSAAGTNGGTVFAIK